MVSSSANAIPAKVGLLRSRCWKTVLVRASTMVTPLQSLPLSEVASHFPSGDSAMDCGSSAKSLAQVLGCAGSRATSAPAGVMVAPLGRGVADCARSRWAAISPPGSATAASSTTERKRSNLPRLVTSPCMTDRVVKSQGRNGPGPAELSRARRRSGRAVGQLLPTRRDLDLLGLGARNLRHADREHPVVERRRDAIVVDVARQLHGALEVAEGDLPPQVAVALLLRLALVPRGDAEHAVGEGDVDLLRRESRHRGRDLVPVLDLPDVDRQVIGARQLAPAVTSSHGSE